jgi:uncharacterized membrane protein (UPF0127 family)
MGWFNRKEKQSRAPEWLHVRNETRGTTLAERADIADDPATRRKGLLGRRALNEGEGLWIVPCQAVHCWGMQFAIDVIYLDRKRKVGKVAPNLKPWRLSLSLTAHSVLELPAGTIELTGTRCGDQLTLDFVGTQASVEP